MKRSFILLSLVAFVLLTWALYRALWASPPIQVPAVNEAAAQRLGEIFRIFYYHVSSAWVSFLCFFANFIASIVYLVRRNAKADTFALATAEVGVVFCTVVLVTGPIWARPVWGIWWTWDARLTTTLVLWLIYVSYLVLRHYSTGQQTPVLAAALAIFGFVDVPIVYMSIRWWRTQHPQPVIAGGQGSFITPGILHILLLNFAAFLTFAALVVWVRYKLERQRQELEELHAMRALAHAEGSVLR